MVLDVGEWCLSSYWRFRALFVRRVIVLDNDKKMVAEAKKRWLCCVLQRIVVYSIYERYR